MESTPPQRSGVLNRSYVAALGLCLALAVSLGGLPASAAAATPTAAGGSMLDGLIRAGVGAGAASKPLEGRKLYVEPRGPARAQETAWRGSRPDDAGLIRRIAEQPQALWLGEWRPNVRATVARRVAKARKAGRVPVLVAYNVPHRDCGQHSSGGAANAAAYREWIDRIAAGIGTAPAIVILEPDALAGMDCLSRGKRRERIQLLKGAGLRLSALPATSLYIDAGNPSWASPGRMAKRLRAVSVGRARGFAVNVAAFETTERSRAYGRAISRRAGRAHFVIDTSRNGAGPSAPGDWCNPGGRALGAFPTTRTGDPLVDAFLWVKRPGESDGTCNGGPPAGTWWPEYALDLARRAAGA